MFKMEISDSVLARLRAAYLADCEAFDSKLEFDVDDDYELVLDAIFTCISQLKYRTSEHLETLARCHRDGG